MADKLNKYLYIIKIANYNPPTYVNLTFKVIKLCNTLIPQPVKLYRDIPPIWTYSLDWKTPSGLKIHFRTLLNACVKLPDVNKNKFTLKELLNSENNNNIAYNQKLPINKAVFDFMLTQLSQEELISDDSQFIIYPAHMPGQVNQILEKYLPSMAYKFGSYCLKDTLVRWKPTVNKSDIRISGLHHKLTFEPEFNSLCLNIRRKIRDRTIILFDDFTTTGMSFEAARNFLEKADIDKLVLCAIGKYARPYSKYSIYEIQSDFNPFIEADKITSKDYSHYKKEVLMNNTSQKLIIEYFNRLARQQFSNVQQNSLHIQLPLPF